MVSRCDGIHITFIGHFLTGFFMDIRSFRESQPAYNSRFGFCKWMNETLNQNKLSVSVAYLRDLESGRSIPSLRLAIAIEDFTRKKVTVRDWVGLLKRKT
mgnify:CR=1 FL=1